MPRYTFDDIDSKAASMSTHRFDENVSLGNPEIGLLIELAYAGGRRDIIDITTEPPGVSGRENFCVKFSTRESADGFVEDAQLIGYEGWYAGSALYSWGHEYRTTILMFGKAEK